MPKDEHLLSTASKKLVDTSRIDDLFIKASAHIDRARETVQHTVNIELINAYWRIGRDIVQDQQEGKDRAAYGRAILKDLSKKLIAHYKRGFSVDSLEKARKFYLIYQYASETEISATTSRISDGPPLMPNLSWSHYVELISISRDEARQFYALEASSNKWTIRELRRQIDSFLYDRLAKAKDKEQVLALAHKGQEINNPQDAIKDPLILEFLGIPEPHKLSENSLESALLNNLQNFLLELGKGFAFIASQQRLSFDNKHFYADLVFYHVVLKCYAIIDLKTHELTHADLGQMQLYVNYYDSEVRQESDNPTIGLVLCTKKNDEMAKYMLGENAKQIFASTYQFHLPTEEELERELKREIKAIKHKIKTDNK